MKKEVKNNKKEINIKRILLIFASIILLFLLVWFGFSFFSMKSDSPYVQMLINLEENSLAQKVHRDFPSRDGKYLSYSFPIILEEYTEVQSEYIIKAVPYEYKEYFKNRDEARFEYSLDKNSGSFDFTKMEWNEPLVITLTYRIDRDFKNFMEYSICTIKRFYANLFNIDNSCARGNCIVERVVNSWSIEKIDKEVADEMSFFTINDQEELVKKLFNFFLTNDFSYFVPTRFKTLSAQISKPDGTYQFSSSFVEDKNSSDDISLFWMLSGVSKIFSEKYSGYEELDLEGYMGNLVEYVKYQTHANFLGCEISYHIITNLYSCKTEKCNVVKEASYNYCKGLISKEIADYSSNNLKLDYLVSLGSEAIYFNRLVDLTNSNDLKIQESKISEFLFEAASSNSRDNSVLNNCYILKGTNDAIKEFNKATYRSLQASTYGNLSNLDRMCDGIIKNRFCTEDFYKKLVCVDAVSSVDKEYAKRILYDLFYEYYFESPAANKISAMEQMKEFPDDMQDSRGIKIDDYGYFVDRQELASDSNDGVTTTNKAVMLDSYYFIYILSKIKNE